MKNSLSTNKKKNKKAYMGISTGSMLEIQWEAVWVEVQSHNADWVDPTRFRAEQRDIPTIDIFVFAGSQCSMTMVLSCSADERLKIPTIVHSSES